MSQKGIKPAVAFRAAWLAYHKGDWGAWMHAGLPKIYTAVFAVSILNRAKERMLLIDVDELEQRLRAATAPKPRRKREKAERVKLAPGWQMLRRVSCDVRG